MIQTSVDCENFLQDQIPHGWQPAHDLSCWLHRRIEFLPWKDRTQVLDDFVWMRARQMLSNEEITAVINRDLSHLAMSDAVFDFATYSSTILTSVLLLLDEHPDVRCSSHALSLLLSKLTNHQDKGLAWAQKMGALALQDRMSELPGFAFLFLTIYPNDSAESFMARDAFWHAMLGN